MIAVSPEPDEGPGLEEGERADEQVGPLAQRAAHVGEDGVEVGQVDDARAVDGEPGGDEHREHGLHAGDLVASHDQRDEHEDGQDEEERLHASAATGAPAPSATGSA